PNLTSAPATETITVAAIPTGAVRVIGNVLVVDPVPRTDKGTNTIAITQTGGNLNVTVNGLLDVNQPAVSSIDRIVVYGSKASDNVTIDPSLTTPATISGGAGGTNVLKAGGGPTRIHAWFGRNTITGSPQPDAITGARGHMRINPTAGNDLIYEGVFQKQPSFNDKLNNAFPNGPRPKHPARGKLPVGQYYRFVNNHLVPIGTPKASAAGSRNAQVDQNLPFLLPGS
ncbi:MAG TPA: hypothetical protein VG406_12340, partial [Isosphaeraceae bacterium]|nr:hypothetical protein [Isosphaeraceae bacterium]